MTPEQKLKWALLIEVVGQGHFEAVTSDNIDDMYEELEESEKTCDDLYDARNDMRGGEVETGLDCEWSRHYENKSVAAKMPDNSWVGWTYWYGGGKHGEPEAFDWMDDAYDLDCKEEEKTIIAREFTKK